MYKNKSVCVVIPAFNEAVNIQNVIHSMPDFIDRIVVVDDGSTDRTASIVSKCMESEPRLLLLRHEKNLGVGRALATGYKWALEAGMKMVVRMDGDGQMNPENLPDLLDPVADGDVDYSKGNRLFTGEAYRKIPRVRYLGNAFLSLLTKIASGYWHVADFQSGYTVISRRALKMVNWDRMYSGYGQPNDLLIRLNVYNIKVRDVPIDPVYNVGEKSGIKIGRIVFSLSWLLIKMFFWRMREKYIIRDFHPLIFFYFLGGLFYLLSAGLFFRVFFFWAAFGSIPSINALAAMFSFMSASQFTLFAMWFDMEANKDLK